VFKLTCFLFIKKKKIVKDKYGEGAALELVEEADDNTSSESEDEGDVSNALQLSKNFFYLFNFI